MKRKKIAPNNISKVAAKEISKITGTSDKINKANKNLTNTPNELKIVEDTGTAMMQTAQQFLLAVEDILIKKFNFTLDDLKSLEGDLSYLLATLGEVDREGFEIMNARDMEAVGELAKRRLINIRKQRPLTEKQLVNNTEQIRKSLDLPEKTRSEIEREVHAKMLEEKLLN